MVTKVITDSCSDITQDEAKRLGITVVPAYVHFGDEVYRDGVDIGADEFYHKLETSHVHPSTATPSPGDFAKAYEAATKETDEVISIHVTSKHSGVCNAALIGKGLIKKKGCHIEIIDSLGLTMWQGLVAIAAARATEAGCNLQQVINKVYEVIDQLRGLAMVDTLSYAVRGGRLGKAVSAIESLVSVKPFLTLRDGQVRLAGIARTRNKGATKLREFLKSTPHIDDLAIVYSTDPEDARSLADYAHSLFPNIMPYIVRLGPVVGVHAGPGTLVAVIRGKQVSLT